MEQVGLWRIADAGPQKLKLGAIGLEWNLEGWIERDPNLLQNGLTIVGRQVRVEGGNLDLLALDPQGRWVVIEIKAGAVRRETIAQAVDYASCVATMPYAQLERKVDEYLAAQAGNDTRLRAMLEERGTEEDGMAGARDVSMFVEGADCLGPMWSQRPLPSSTRSRRRPRPKSWVRVGGGT